MFEKIPVFCGFYTASARQRASGGAQKCSTWNTRDCREKRICKRSFIVLPFAFFASSRGARFGCSTWNIFFAAQKICRRCSRVNRLCNMFFIVSFAFWRLRVRAGFDAAPVLRTGGALFAANSLFSKKSALTECARRGLMPNIVQKAERIFRQRRLLVMKQFRIHNSLALLITTADLCRSRCCRMHAAM